jgi:hypothetical protein
LTLPALPISNLIDISSLTSLITKSSNQFADSKSDSNDLINSLSIKTAQTPQLDILPKPHTTSTHLIKKSTNSSAHINLLNSLLSSNNSRAIRSSPATSATTSNASSRDNAHSLPETMSTSLVSTTDEKSKLFEALQSIKFLGIKQSDTELKIQYYNRFSLLSFTVIPA